MSGARHPPLACRPSPPQGARSFASPPSPISNVGKIGPARELPISPLAGEMPGRAEGGASRQPWLVVFLATLALFSPASADPLPSGFVRLADVDATIRQDIRYAGADNFLRRKVDGYEAPVCILTEQAARALSNVQKAIAAKGLTLVVFDCYRPARAVADMVRWTMQGGPPDPQWYLNVDRGDLIAKGYVGELSSHSRGSTVDLAIAEKKGNGTIHPTCGAPDAGTLDFGTGFDCFDPASETARRPLPIVAAANRKILLSAMRAAGFRNYAREWWHFTLAPEPFPKQRFDFPVTAQ
ncbi:D-alanyl-D-alanine dipeptidase [Mesorhizobium sp. M3A.F.Ca.ET.174.01.1.1]|nr:D-alanyl-D-alanine dipeptidase [Mesorhizobium sp. M3A.F.Ca.ET.080.04.2.1]PBB84879.1 D-alanyl-D-alanine dipeptidase [Mesorhizobium sp. WSM3876]RWB89818.1 MAG: D-alanyl-D-alanine dipeptidase [Mesorhizobium sp.]TGS67751.1 D-alanyl-D-alanine dipeptidase [Mesorhizobium sp. M3A.F.Ca.ET.201.01.1.1]TGS86787.1 D-alanyl-D-alanine dipeptidase [Mesorhizobium sp. M3A.F.Ca.ET.175.01.1.1]TGT25236.1 D-alanyl-D-alanine dipeptidase [Mesorhizobium sp. M3A.F.Ca.ET.174.01.1.1]TGT58887.1 D-alanyl-D-alanine dipe